MTKKGFDTFVKGILNAKPVQKKPTAKPEGKKERAKEQER